ncbi:MULTISPECIES: translation initiation factor IF-2 [Brevibacillus]|jgi:translation initiation factor IF-2|uniref:Translation initiation factor IF-2 n=2 Tax=Bacillati TaxID=1783272 RepID=M8EFC0_9BACL|nr:translation initiation factor IF-2 [Brevibacillus borstelensis]EMT54145.1 translation initiation factor IF-2 [Brevibacillus borstelensis AK1]KKX53971.1 translation initiation factor IF-2 [Brevibacillus borstelensis cifa_chp40]MBE5397994.1 translation initiation factor IF-2 [Brevibacillus borstelensis]MCC0563491.1 translation initiation factor IF-2 [Brevibacillus borstelensis]MCM3470018.1 translation initiation factor IF-2 [Brevibacillus borstelensis]
MKTRVYEYAKQHNMSSKEILNLLKRLNIEVANHMSIMDEPMVKKIEEHLAKLRSGSGKQQEQQRSSGQREAKPAKTEEKKRDESKGQTQRTGQSNQQQQQHRRNDRPGNQTGSRPGGQRPDQSRPQHGKNQGKNQERKPNDMRSQPGKPLDRKPVNQQEPTVNEKDDVRTGEDFEEKVNIPNKVSLEKREKIKKAPGPKKTFEDNKKSQPFKGGNKRQDNRRHGGQREQQQQRPVLEPPSKITFTESLTVGELAKKLRKEPAEIIKKLFNLGIMATINQDLDRDAIELICSEYNVEVEEKIVIDETNFETIEEVDNPADMVERPPVVTIMGHVDHGKTTLLDAIRSTNVVAGEAGGITQHIGAYQVEIKGKKITFLDTPGHAAFTTMRARGAQITDITILVVAADDGVKPQTIEAISHAKAAKVPIIVAVNKVDKPEANIDRIKQELTEYELVAEEWGGDTIFSPISAKQRQGIEELLEYILLVSEVQELKANPNKRARGTVVEAELDKGRGPVATVLVQHGTLKVGDPIVVGSAFGRVRAMVNDKGRRMKEAGPSTPVEITGLNDVPQAGDQFMVFEDEKKARAIGEARASKQRESERRANTRVSLDDLFQHIQEGDIKELNLIVKADVQGSVEALRGSLEKIDVNGTRVKIIHTGVGAITESDITLANASNAIVIGFNVRPEPNARSMAEQESIDIRLHRVIYTVIEEIEQALKGMLDPVYKESIIGQAEIREVFKVSKVGNIAGCYVTEGKLTRDAGARLIREGVVIYEGKLDTLKRFKDDAKEVAAGYECGLTLERYHDIKVGDVIEAFVMEEVKQ